MGNELESRMYRLAKTGQRRGCGSVGQVAHFISFPFLGIVAVFRVHPFLVHNFLHLATVFGFFRLFDFLIMVRGEWHRVSTRQGSAGLI
jgi:hypothetical protein